MELQRPADWTVVEYASGQSMNRWWSTKSMVGNEVVAVVDDLLASESGIGRRAKAEQQLASYHGCDPKGLGLAHFNGVMGEPTASINTIRRIVDTGVAKIASQQRPKAQVLTKGADYRTRYAARNLSKFLEAQNYQEQGSFSTGWDLAEQIFKDACIWGTGIIKVFADMSQERIRRERVYLWDLLVDDYDAEYGDPQNLFHIYRYDKHLLAERFPKNRFAIMNAEGYPELIGGHDYRRSHDFACVYEAWRKPLSKDKPGRHVICVKGGDGTDNVLVDEPWKRQSFPFVWLRWKRNSAGIWSASLVDEVADAQATLDEMFEYLNENAQLNSGGRIFVSQSNKGIKDKLQENDAMNVIEVPDINGVKVEMPAPFNPGYFQFLELLRGIPFEQSGINEATSQGRKEPGLESGRALLTMGNQQSALFLPQSRAYEQLFVDLAKRDLDAANDLVDSNKDLALALPSEGFLDELDFKEIRLKTDLYKVTVQASSSMEDTLAGRRQTVAELVQAGNITSPATIERLLTTPNPDLESMQSARQSQYRYIASMIGDFMRFDATKEQDEEEIFEAPEKYLILDDAIVQMTQAYYEMKEMRAPEENLRLARNWIDAADKLIQERDRQAQAPMQGAPPGAPMGGGEPMGMPMGAPPPEMLPAA